MPIGEYFGGKGRKVMGKMKEQYGERKGEQVFHATAEKRGMKPGDKPKRTFGQRIAQRSC